MKRLSVRAILIGLGLILLIGVGLTFLGSYYAIDVYNSVVAENQVAAPSDIEKRFAFHPFTIVLTILATVVGFGVPGYITAVIANKLFVLHSFLVGLLGACVALLDFESLMTAPWFSAGAALASILVATGGGKLRELQTRSAVR